MVTSYCPDALAATDLVLESTCRLRVFYDLDTPVTLAGLAAGEAVDYIGTARAARFRSGAELYRRPVAGRNCSSAWARAGWRRFMAASIRKSTSRWRQTNAIPRRSWISRNVCGGSTGGVAGAACGAGAAAAGAQIHDWPASMYDQGFPWQQNIFFVGHLPPADHPAFYCSTRLTLNVTRRAMAETGYCPSGRLFEAAACGAAMLSDYWEGLEQFFEPGSEILLAEDTEEAVAALDRSPEDLARIARRPASARSRKIRPTVRAVQLEEILDSAVARVAASEGRRFDMWGIIPAAGKGSRIQPLAFSKELLPVVARGEGGEHRPRAVSDYLIERLVIGGATRLCFVISPRKSDILEYYGGSAYGVPICYCVQPEPQGLCDAIFRALPVIDLTRTRAGRPAGYSVVSRRTACGAAGRPTVFSAVSRGTPTALRRCNHG